MPSAARGAASHGSGEGGSNLIIVTPNIMFAKTEAGVWVCDRWVVPKTS